MPGRPVKPTGLLKLERGKLYGKPAERSEMEPKSDLRPRCPKILTKEERRSWKYYAQILKAFGLFSIANSPLLDMLARLQAEVLKLHEKCQEIIIPKKSIEAFDKKGKVISKTRSGYAMNPFWLARHKNEDQIMAILRELGLSSMGMAKIGQIAANKKKERNEFFED